MRIAVFSDTHGRIAKCVKVIESLGQVDYIIHLGDVKRDVADLGIMFPQIPLLAVSGNSDLGEAERVVELAGKRIFLCHGHTCSVKTDLSVLAHKAAAENCDIALFGHTHEGFDGVVDNLHLFNPGSISIPLSGTPSYGLLTIEGDAVETELRTV